jgi:CheY-like chemotaxis protein
MPARSAALNVAPLNADGTLPRLMEPEPALPAREQPRLVPAPRKTGAVKSAFIERLEAGFKSPQLPEPQTGAVLILESDLSIRKLLRRLLDRRGYTTVEIEQASDLAAQLLSQSAQLLVVDAAAGIDARVLEGLARAHPDLKILVLSEEPLVRTDQQTADRLLELSKPFSLDRFTECVDRLLGRPAKSQ